MRDETRATRTDTLSLRLMCNMIIYIYNPVAWTTGKLFQSLTFQCSQSHVSKR